MLLGSPPQDFLLAVSLAAFNFFVCPTDPPPELEDTDVVRAFFCPGTFPFVTFAPFGFGPERFFAFDSLKEATG